METRLWENQKANSGFQKLSLSKRGWCAKPYLWKWVLFCMNKKNIFISIAVHLVSLWHRGLKQLGNSLLYYPLDRNSFRGLCYPPSKLLRYFFPNSPTGERPEDRPFIPRYTNKISVYPENNFVKRIEKLLTPIYRLPYLILYGIILLC